tara:strand:+ start:151 stop:534 length:384 start_codon:yes stop_codon:yes gene_type:complete
MKECIICNKFKSEFPTRSNGRLRGECKECTARIARDYRKENSQKIRLQAASNTYNISIKEAQNLYSKNKCSICGKTPKTQKGLCIDHCHKTGKVRDLLCTSCNFALGYFKDSEDTMLKAINYINKHK